MSLVNRIAGAMRAELSSVPAPTDDYWYGPIGYGSASGMKVSPESAMRTATVFACVNVISKSFAMLPGKVFQWLSNGDRKVATGHPIYDLIASQPNRWQTAYEFKRMMSAHAELRGIGIAEIIPGPRGAVDQLIPLHPDRITIERLSDGMLRYKYADPWNGATRVLLQDEVFRVGEFAGDGISPLSTIAASADTVGIELAAQDYGSRFFENDAKPGVVLTGGVFKDNEARNEFRKNWQESQTGANRHKTAVLPSGMEIKELGIKNTDAQYLELRKFNRSQIAAIFGVPGHKIGDTDKAATFASVEQFALQFVIDCIMPRAVMWEQAIQRDLIWSPSYYVKYNLSALLRGDAASRGAFYKLMIEIGVFSPNDVRDFEEMNRRKGGDVYLTPLNYRESGPDAVEAPTVIPPATQQAQARLALMANSAAERAVRKEVAAVTKLRERNANGHFAEAASEFYNQHAAWLSETLSLPLSQTQQYCSENLATLVATTDLVGWSAAIERDGVQQLAKLAMEVKP